jgi:hypothetical protein
MPEHQIETHVVGGDRRRADERLHGSGHRLAIARGMGDQRAHTMHTPNRVIRGTGGMHVGCEPARHIGERVRRTGDRHRTRHPDIR